MQVSESNINISPSNYEHVRLSSVDSATTSSSSSQASSDGSHILSSGTLSESALSLSPFTSPPTTPRSPLPPSRLYHRFTSHEQLSSLARGHKRDWESTSDGLNDAEDKFTQLPIPSSRERRSSSVTLSSHHSARSRRSLANLRKSLVFNNSGIDEELSSSTPKGLLTPQSGSIEGPRLSRKHIEASRRSAREALEEDLRNLETEGSRNDDFVLDCYFTSLDYLIKALKTENEEVLDVKTRRSVRARLQTLSDALSTPEELANEQAQVLKNLSKELQGTVNGHVSRCSCVVTTVTDYIILLFNIIASSLLAIIVCIVDMVATSSSEEDSSHSKID